MTTRHVLLAAMLASILALAGPAQALYLVTPLRLDSDRTSADVGESIDLDLSPENGSMAELWKGKSVLVRYHYDPDERAEPDQPTSSDGTRERSGVILDALALDERASARFTWTIPDEVDGHNVAIRVLSQEGELLAVRDIAVGDAPPVMRAMGGSDDGREPAPPLEQTPDERAPTGDAANDEEAASVPGAGLVAGLAALGAAAIATRRRVG